MNEDVDCVYRFEDLSPKAKEKAREKFRGNDYYPYDEWWDCVYTDATKCGELLGITIDTSKRRTMSDEEIDYSTIGFELHRQGAGVSFKGSYSPVDKPMGTLEHAPLDETLKRLAERLTALQMAAKLKYDDQIVADIKPSRSYGLHVVVWTQEFVPSCGLRRPDETSPTEEEERELIDIIEKFADWIFTQLNEEYDYLVSDECVDGYLEDLTFDEEGEEVEV